MTVKIDYATASGYVKKERTLLHAWGTKNPFTLATITLVVGLAIGVLFF